LLEDLHTFVLAGEDGDASQKFEENAAGCPDIDRLVVEMAPHDQFWCPVVSADYVGGVEATGVGV